MRLVVTCPDPHEAGEFGVQDKRKELHGGERQADGSLRYEVDVTIRSVAGRPRDFAGSFVHGVRGERFLYLSFRDGAGSAWRRRCKIMLPAVAPEHGDSLVVSLADVSRSRARLAGEWTVR